MVQPTKIYRVEESKCINGEWGTTLNFYYSSKKKAIEAARLTAEIMAISKDRIEDEVKESNRIWYTHKDGNFCSIYIHVENLW